MNPDDWKKLSRIFDLVLTLPPEGRTDYIKRVCGDDEELEQKIRDMLDQLEESDRFFEERLGKNEELFKELDSLIAEQIQDEDYFEGKTIGRWEILELIGHGGMGRVYKVQRVDESGIKQTGALKIIHKSLLTPSHMERFRLEQHILSGLQHPNISGFVDSGITADRVPYMVMEYVEGEPILEYCNNHRLTIEQRIELFLTVCKTIQYAHNSLIVHRDLKPENILVTKEGRIKILDFGIAKLLDPNLYENSAVETQPGMRMLSLTYASPEQISGRMITTSSDLYSLGILLSKLLIGLHPFELTGLSYKEIEKHILQEDPVPASRRYQSFKELDAKRTIAKERKRTPQEIINKLKGDLDAIIYKALRKDPDRRYSSVETFITDLERHQSNLPILARPDTFAYRSQKFVHRHKLGIAAIAIIFLVLGGGIVATIWQAQQAQQNAREAEQVSAFLAQIFEGADPNRSNDGSMTARELLDQGFERVQTELEDEPALQAQILSMIGNIYSNLGLYDDAYLAIEKSVELFHGIGDSSPRFATALLRLANLEYRLNNFEDAADAAREALELNITHYGDDHAEVATVLNTLAMSLEEIGEKEEAYEMYYRIIDIRRGQPDQGSNLAVNLNNLAILLQEDGNLDEADALFSEAVELIDDVLGEEHPFMAYTLNGYSGVHQDRGEYDLAEADLRRALKIGQAIFPDDHPFIAVVLHNLGALYEEMEQFENAANHYREGLTLRQSSLPPNHPDIASSLYAIGTVLIKNDNPDVAESYFRDALEIRKIAYEEYDWRIAQVESHLGRSLLRQQRYEEATILLENSYPILEEELGSNNLNTQRTFEDIKELDRLSQQSSHTN
jgi:serine/threonine-protein kinase